MRARSVSSDASSRTTKSSVCAHGVQQRRPLARRRKRAGEEQQVVALVAVHAAQRRNVPRAGLRRDWRVRPAEGVDLEACVHHVPIVKQVGEGLERRRLARSGRAGDDQRVHAGQYRGPLPVACLDRPGGPAQAADPAAQWWSCSVADGAITMGEPADVPWPATGAGGATSSTRSR